MTFSYFEEHFTKRASQAGYSEDNIQKCLTYAKPLITNGLPVIFNTSNLSALVGYKKTYIKKSVLYPDHFYRRFEVKKKNGSTRYLEEPLPSLKEIQCWILKNILYEVPVSRFAKAYVPKRDLLDNVKYHKNKESVISLDIEIFFTSIQRISIEQIFLGLGYSSNISNLLSKLCCCNETLPQGAPTSPYLSNIFLVHFDSILSVYCRLNNIRYTRYADDIILSGEIDAPSAIEFVRMELFKIGLTLNEQKIKVMGKNFRQIVTGIVVNSVIQTPKKQRDKIRQEIYYIKRFTLEGHLKKTNNKRANYVKHLIGKINFALFINPLDNEMQAYRKYMSTYLKVVD